MRWPSDPDPGLILHGPHARSPLAAAGAYFLLPLAVADGDLGENGRLQLQGERYGTWRASIGPRNCRCLFTGLLPATTAVTDNGIPILPPTAVGGDIAQKSPAAAVGGDIRRRFRGSPSRTALTSAADNCISAQNVRPPVRHFAVRSQIFPAA